MRIKELKIYSQNLAAQNKFYTDVLSLEISAQTKNSISLRIGQSLLTIEQAIKSTPYHFAINIPANQEVEALNWLKTKVNILKHEENDIQDFDFWNESIHKITEDDIIESPIFPEIYESLKQNLENYIL